MLMLMLMLHIMILIKQRHRTLPHHPRSQSRRQLGNNPFHGLRMRHGHFLPSHQILYPVNTTNIRHEERRWGRQSLQSYAQKSPELRVTNCPDPTPWLLLRSTRRARVDRRGRPLRRWSRCLLLLLLLVTLLPSFGPGKARRRIFGRVFGIGRHPEGPRWGIRGLFIIVIC